MRGVMSFFFLFIFQSTDAIMVLICKKSVIVYFMHRSWLDILFGRIIRAENNHEDFCVFLRKVNSLVIITRVPVS